MNSPRPLLFAALLPLAALADAPKLPGVGAAMQTFVDKHEIAGAVTMVVTKDKVLHLETTGFADLATKKPMSADSIFWIKSMTKPVTAVGILMLQDAGKLNIGDPVAKYLPEFANLKTPSGQPANLTLAQLLTHTSGLGEGLGEAGSKADPAHTLADLVRQALASPMQFEPGTHWKYTQSGINTAGRIIEVVSGVSYDQFLSHNLFEPLGMTDAHFFPDEKAQERIATLYAKNKTTGELEPLPKRTNLAPHDRPPLATSELYCTAPDYARFCQMLLNGGALGGKRYLSAAAMKLLTTVQTGDLPTGFFQNDTYGQRGANYGWGIGTCILKTPHPGVGAMLSPGSYGHGGAFGTQAWIDPVKGVAYILMVQRSNFPNSDASDVRRDFQQAAVDALVQR